VLRTFDAASDTGAELVDVKIGQALRGESKMAEVLDTFELKHVSTTYFLSQSRSI
jgi:hypothetical protein